MRWKHRPSGSNWGEFGEDDQIGRLNLLTPERRLAAIREVREGCVFPLSLPLDYPGGAGVIPFRSPPRIEATVRATGDINYNYPYSRENPVLCDVISDDVVTIWTQYSTQWDAFSHWGQEFDADGDGVAEIVYYNGFTAKDHVLGPDREGGPCALKLGIEHAAEAAIQARGVLLDLVSLYGQESARVGYDGLMKALDRQGLTIETGDILCIYTGWADVVLGMKKNPDFNRLNAMFPVLDGSDKALLNWITQSGVVAICADNVAVESRGHFVTDGAQTKRSMLPLHEHCLFKLGVMLGEMWHFGALAQWLRAHRRSRFLLTAPPLRLPGAVGSPVMPVATV